MTLYVPALEPDAGVLAAALAYAKAGWYVGPARAGTKDPGSVLGKGWQMRTSRDPQVLVAWFAGTDHGVFLHCGRSGALVFDVDTPENLHPLIAQAVAETSPPWQSTRPEQPTRRHYLFAQPVDRMLGNSLGRLAGGWGEVRGQNGVIVVAPSPHADGGRYDWGHVGAVPPLPSYLLAELPDALDAADAATDDQVRAFFERHRGSDRPELVEIHLRAFENKVAAGESRHHTMTGHLSGAMKEARLGCYPANLAADTLQSAFLAAVGVDGTGKQGDARTPAQARSEWRGLIAWAVAQAEAADPGEVRARLAEKVPDLRELATIPDPALVSTPLPLEAGAGTTDDQTDAALDAAAFMAREVEREAFRLRVRHAATEKVAAERAAGEDVPPFDAGLLSEVLARPAEPPHRVESLIPSEAGTLIVAQRKTGKTTWQLNLARSLILGGDFLGRFAVRPVTGRVGFLNFEVSAAQLARWAHEAGVPEDRLYLVNLRGRRNPFIIDADREHLAEQLRAHEVESLIVDPFGRAFTGKSQNDPGEVGSWLADLDRFARGDAGVADVILAAHAGWDGERTRGSSALEDWADVIVTLVRDREDDQERYMRAEGRDVLIEEDRLDFDAASRALTLAGAGSRKTAAKTRHLEQLIPPVVAIVRGAPGITGYKIGQALRESGHAFQKGDESKAASLAVDRGLLDCETGARNSRRYFEPENIPPPRPPQTSPAGKSDDLPDLPYKGEVVLGEVKGLHLPEAHLLRRQPTPCERCEEPNPDYEKHAYCRTCWPDVSRERNTA